MKILRRLFITMLAATAIAAAAFAADANVAGEWDFQVETQAGSGSPGQAREEGLLARRCMRLALRYPHPGARR